MNKYALRQSLLTVTISSALASGTALAATITVDTNTDGPIGMVSGCSLREAIASANDGNSQGGCSTGSMAADTIIFDPSLANTTITLNQGSAITITSSLSIIGPVSNDPAGLVIDGDNLSQVFAMEGPSDVEKIDVDIGQLTLTRGRETGTEIFGGAISGNNSNLSLEDTLITGNSLAATGAGTAAYGGGVSVLGGNVSLVNSQITGNAITAEASGENASAAAAGGGLVVSGGLLSLVNSAISGNTSLATSDGLNANSVAVGGTIAIYGELLVFESSLSGNSAIATATGAEAESTSYGGGLVGFGTPGTIVGSVFSDNSVSSTTDARGGGLHLSAAEIELTNSTISGNSLVSADTRGGGIYLAGVPSDEEPGVVVADHSTIAFNTASNGNDGIYVAPDDDSSVTLNRSLVVQAGASEVACSAPATFADSLATDASCTGTATPLSDIALAGLSDNGGLTLTHGLLPGSVAIDAISPCFVLVNSDQRGLPRPATAGSDCDIGAFELQPDDDLDGVFSDRFED